MKRVAFSKHVGFGLFEDGASLIMVVVGINHTP